jgi:hypothetical protein
VTPAVPRELADLLMAEVEVRIKRVSTPRPHMVCSPSSFVPDELNGLIERLARPRCSRT